MQQTETKIYDVLIVGGGVTGTALLYTLSKYTDLQRIALVEKYREIAHLNSHYNSNSQTLHFGDIETNYTLEKARAVKENSSLLAGYAQKYAPDAIMLSHKMVLAVGKQEVQELEQRYVEFQMLYPHLEKMGRAELAQLEPSIIKERDPQEEVLALVSRKGYALNYQKIANSFVHEAQKENKTADLFLGEEVLSITKQHNVWQLKTDTLNLQAKYVVFAAGPHSLLFAKKLGYGKEMGILPVAGSFYTAYGFLKGKVYTMQIKELPFAAIHGDPNVNNPHETRFGPTAKPLPLLERHHWNTLSDFLRTSVYTLDGILSLVKIISNKTIFFYVLKNIAYDLPYFGKRMFLKEARKIVPSIRLKDLEYGRNLGGIRPQVVDTKSKQMQMGAAKITRKKIIFDITPSPGASVCLANAQENALLICQELAQCQFEQARFKQDHAFEY